MLDLVLAIVIFTLATVYKDKCQATSHGPAPRSTKGASTSAAGMKEEKQSWAPACPLATAKKGVCDAPCYRSHVV